MKNEFYTIATFEYTADAQILRGKLMSEDIEVFLRDEHTIDTDPLVSHAIGGVKLQVHINDKEKALAIYEEVREYEKDEQGKLLICENCHQQKIVVAPYEKTFWNSLFPFFEKKKYICAHCGEVYKKTIANA